MVTILVPHEKGFTLKGNNLFPLWWTRLFSRGRKTKQDVTKFISLVQNDRKPTKCIIPHKFQHYVLLFFYLLIIATEKRGYLQVFLFLFLDENEVLLMSTHNICLVKK